MKVCRLLKSLYGLKQAPRCWNQRLTVFLSSCGLRESQADPCLYMNLKADSKLLVGIYVDDGLIAATKNEDIKMLLEQMKAEFEMTVSEEVTGFLGFEICQQENGIFVHQAGYAKKVLKRFEMDDCKSIKTPIDTNWSTDDNEDVTGQVPYREAVGNLMYLMVVSRPDIAFAINVASHALEKPTTAHWKLVKRILRYIKGTLNTGLLYKNKDYKDEMMTYSDADYAGDKQTRKSTTGIVCKNAGAAIIWKSKLQSCIAQSTTEAEYIAASTAAKEIVWLKLLLKDLGVNIQTPILYVDNQSAIKLMRNPEFHQRTKHIDVRYHFIRDLVEKDEIGIEYVGSEDQEADGMTKGLTTTKFNAMKDNIGLKELK